MKVRVLYFASVRERLGKESEEIDLPAGIATVSGLRAHLRDRGGAWAEALGEGKLVRVSVNMDMANAAAPIRAGDEVAFFPPVTGG